MSNPILSQPRATRGKTVGKAVIKSYIHDVVHGGEPNFKPLYTQNRFNAMVEGLGSEREYAIYLQYVAVFNGISEELVRAQGYVQQAQHGLAHLQSVLEDVRRAQELSDLLDRLETLTGLAMVKPQPEVQDILARLRGLPLSLKALEADAPLRENLRAFYDFLLLPALRGLSAYDTLLGLLAEALDIPELIQLRAPMDDIHRDLDLYEAEYEAARRLLPNHPLLPEAFPPLSVYDTRPDPALVEAASARLGQPDALKTGIVRQLFLLLLGQEV